MSVSVGWTNGIIRPFLGTDLDIRLRERGVDTVVLTGVLFLYLCPPYGYRCL